MDAHHASIATSNATKRGQSARTASEWDWNVSLSSRRREVNAAPVRNSEDESGQSACQERAVTYPEGCGMDKTAQDAQVASSDACATQNSSNGQFLPPNSVPGPTSPYWDFRQNVVPDLQQLESDWSALKDVSITTPEFWRMYDGSLFDPSVMNTWDMDMNTETPRDPSSDHENCWPANILTGDSVPSCVIADLGTDSDIAVTCPSLERPPTFEASGTSFPMDQRASDRLFLVFDLIVALPASLLAMDLSGMQLLRDYVRATALKNDAVRCAYLALTLLYIEHGSDYSATAMALPSELNAVQLQHVACHLLQKEAASTVSIAPDTDCLLVAVFLLAWFDVIRDQGRGGLDFPSQAADSIITSKTHWSPRSRLLLKCLSSVDAKASLLRTKLLFPSSSLVEMYKHRSQIEGGLDGAGKSGPSHGMVENVVQSVDDAADPFSMSHSDSEWAGNDAQRHHEISPLHIMQMQTFDCLLQPALEFHIISLGYLRKVTLHQHHQRSRGTVEDEFDVVTACGHFESELLDMWARRPTILDIKSAELIKVVSQSVAKSLLRTLCVYVATFWSHFLHLHRTAWWPLSLSDQGNAALDRMWETMHSNPFEKDSLKDEGLHPGLIWPLFLFGIECKTQSQQIWALHQMENFGTRTVAKPSSVRGVPQLGAYNAQRVAALLAEVIKRQNHSRFRIDFRAVAEEMFGCYISII